MFLRVSKLLSITLLIYLVGIAVAESNGDDDNETPSKTEKDAAEENQEEATEKALEEAIEKAEEEMVSEMAPVVSEMMEEEKSYVEKVAEELASSEKPQETEEESVTAAEEEEPESKPETPEEKPETTSAAAMVNTDTTIEKEEAPKETFAVWSSKGKICLLAKFHAVFSVLYSSQRGEEKAEVTIPKTAVSKGKCGSNAKLPLLQISWEKYAFTIMFNKTDEDNWAVTSMELTYDTSDPLFDGAVNAGKKTARSKAITKFETPLKNSYFCPARETVLLYSGNKQVVTARISDLQLQPFEIEKGEFSPIMRCNKVVIDEETPYVQDETVPFAVGCTLALITLIILMGFSIHRAYHAAKVDYNSME